MKKRLVRRLLSAVLILSVLLSLGITAYAQQEENEVVPPQVSLSVEYSKPKFDGRLDAWVTVSADKGTGENAPGSAVDVELEVQAHELIRFLDVSGPYEIAPQPENRYRLSLHDITSGQSETCSLRMEVKFDFALLLKNSSSIDIASGLYSSIISF